MNTVHDQIVAAIMGTRPGAEWNLRGETYEGIEWLDQVQTKPTKEELGL